MKDNLSKRADLEYRKLAAAYNPELPMANITWEQVWNTLCDKAEIGGSLETTKNKQSVFELYKGDDVVHSFSWENADVFDESAGDWDWTKILREVLGYVISNKVIKKPRMKRSDAGKPKAVSKKNVEKPKKSVKKPAKKQESAQVLTSKYPEDIIALFSPVENLPAMDITPVEVERWKAKLFSIRTRMYSQYKQGKEWKMYLPKYFGIIKAMRSHGINRSVKADWLRKEVGLPLD